jgi:hypothetical protein
VRLLIRMDRLHHVFNERQELVRVKSLHSILFASVDYVNMRSHY